MKCSRAASRSPGRTSRGSATRSGRGCRPNASRASRGGTEITPYLRKMKIACSRREVSQFLKEPGKYLVGLKKERQEKHLERGLHFMELGDDRIDDAITEFEKIVQL